MHFRAWRLIYSLTNYPHNSRVPPGQESPVPTFPDIPDAPCTSSCRSANNCGGPTAALSVTLAAFVLDPITAPTTAPAAASMATSDLRWHWLSSSLVIVVLQNPKIIKRTTSDNSLSPRGREREREIASISFGHPLTATCNVGTCRPVSQLENREEEQGGTLSRQVGKGCEKSMVETEKNRKAR